MNGHNRKDEMLESAANAAGVRYEDLSLPIELTLWVDPNEVCCRFGENRGSYCTLASFDDDKPKSIDDESASIEDSDVSSEEQETSSEGEVSFNFFLFLLKSIRSKKNKTANEKVL